MNHLIFKGSFKSAFILKISICNLGSLHTCVSERFSHLMFNISEDHLHSLLLHISSLGVLLGVFMVQILRRLADLITADRTHTSGDHSRLS